MTTASKTAGFVGKFGDTTFTSLSAFGTPAPRKTSNKFFKSRNNDPPPTSSVVRDEPEPVRDALSSVTVAVRARPLLPAEINRDPKANTVVDVNEPANQIIVALEKSFAFDVTYDENTPQSRVYAQSVHPVVTRCVKEGISGTVIAYGQTGTGKTYTMGTNAEVEESAGEDSKGMIPRALEEIFQTLSESKYGASIKISFFEIHQEQIYDLLNPSEIRVPLTIREEGTRFVIPTLTKRLTTSSTEAIRVLEEGSRTRSTGATSMNADSSRSHAIFTVHISRGAGDQSSTAKLNLVDLAGSESVRRTHATGKTRNEGININKGLLALGSVITEMCKKRKHINFRDSALTKVLRDSLQGRGMTTMIACISPTEDDLSETMTTLRYADRAKEIDKPPIPQHLLLHQQDISRKRRMVPQIPPTPAKWRRQTNTTIATATPTKTPLSAAPSKLNSTLGSAGREPLANSFGRRVTSTASRRPVLETITDENVERSPDSLSDISSIRAPMFAGNSTSISNLSVQDQSILSPLLSRKMRSMQETLQETFNERMLTMEKNLMKHFMSKHGLDVRRSPRINRALANDLAELKSPADDDTEKSKGRSNEKSLSDVTNKRRASFKSIVSQTASSPELKDYTENTNTDSETRPPRPSIAEMEAALGIDPGSPLFDSPTPEKPCVAREPRTSRRLSRRTTMIASDTNWARGAVKNDVTESSDTVDDNDSNKTRRKTKDQPLIDVTNKRRSCHKRIVSETASPDLRKSCGKEKADSPETLPGRPSIAEMEAALGIDPCDPLFDSPPKKPQEQKKPSRRSSRRTTMIAPDRSLSDFRKSMAPPPRFRHPLDVKEHWKVDPRNQKQHNEDVLRILNTGNMKILQMLPAIGPKAAMIIHSHRELRGGFSSFEDLQAVPGLQKSFFVKFCRQNLISL